MKPGLFETKKLSVVATAVAISLGLSFPAISAGDAGDSSSGTTKSKVKKPAFAVKCKDGKVWVKKKFRCMAEDEAKKLEQSSLYELGRDFAYAGDYGKAIKWLKAAPNQNDHRVNNMLGFAHRKSGKMDEALGYYYASIDANPNYSLVREYLGEAYIQLGQLEKAREQLTEIERICGGRSCGEYGQLASLIVDAQRNS